MNTHSVVDLSGTEEEMVTLANVRDSGPHVSVSIAPMVPPVGGIVDTQSRLDLGEPDKKRRSYSRDDVSASSTERSGGITNCIPPLIPAPLYAKEPVIRKVSAHLHAIWKVQENPSRNPCPQPVSLERAHIPTLMKGKYVVADKSDGTRFSLLLTRVDGREMSFLIDRKMSMYQIPVAASKAFFDGSLFDGELVWSHSAEAQQSPCQTFLIFDLVALRGSDEARNFTLLKRLELIRNLFDTDGITVNSPRHAHALAKAGKIICGGNSHGLSFKPKECFHIDMMDTLLRKLSSLPYKTDGIVFTPVNCGGVTGTHPTLFKLKSLHTVDVECTVPPLPPTHLIFELR